MQKTNFGRLLGWVWRGFVVAMLVGPVGAFEETGNFWVTPEVAIRTNLGGSELTDGTASFDTVFAQAAARWNSEQALPALRVTRDASIVPGDLALDGNDLNDVFFAPTVYGVDFEDGVLAAVLVSAFSDGEIAEVDIIFNSAFEWDSYTGALVPDTAGTGTRADFRRAALNQIGQLLGLGFPDTDTPPSIMFSGAQDTVEDLQEDDVAGFKAIYAKVTFRKDPAVALTTPAKVKTAKRAHVFRGTAAGGTRIVVQNLKNGSSKFFPVAADGTWKARIKLLEGKNRFIVVVVDASGLPTARTTAVVIQKPKKPKRPKRPKR